MPKPTALVVGAQKTKPTALVVGAQKNRTDGFSRRSNKKRLSKRAAFFYILKIVSLKIEDLIL